MADAATVVMKSTILPDEIAKIITATTTVEPKDANDKWYYKLTSVTAASTDLIAGSYIDYTAVAANTSPDAVDAADKVEFLFIQNTDAPAAATLSPILFEKAELSLRLKSPSKP
jgi:hypothetical protein